MSTPLPQAQQAVLQRRTVIQPVVRCVARYGNQSEPLALSGGTITIDRRRKQRTTATLTAEVRGAIPTILSPLGTELDIEAGIRLVTGAVAYVPLVTGLVVTGVNGIVQRGATVSIQGTEISDRVARWRFEQPFTVTAPVDLGQVVNLILNNRGLPSTVGNVGVTLIADRVFGLDANKDPWAELIDLVESFGWRLWIDRSGHAVLDQPPIPGAPRDALVLVPNISISNRPPNVVVGRWEPTDGSAPVYAIAEDDNPASQTFVGGPYKRVTYFFASTLPISQVGADQAVQTLLVNQRYQGAGWAWTTPFDPTIDPDDVLHMSNQDPEVQVPDVQVDAVTIDLTGETSIEGKELPS